MDNDEKVRYLISAYGGFLLITRSLRVDIENFDLIGTFANKVTVVRIDSRWHYLDDPVPLDEIGGFPDIFGNNYVVAEIPAKIREAIDAQIS